MEGKVNNSWNGQKKYFCKKLEGRVTVSCFNKFLTDDHSTQFR